MSYLNVENCYVAVMPAKRSRKCSTRRPWTNEERDAVRSSFAKYFAVKRALPGKDDIEQCIKTHPCLAHRSWGNIKDFIRNFQTKLSC